MKGPALLLAGIGLFGTLDANSKLLSGHYSVGQAIALRYVVLLLLFLAVQAAKPGALGPVAAVRPFAHLARALCMMVSAAGFFLGFRRLPLAEGYLVFFSAPLFTLGLCAVLLGERAPRAAWAWCGAGFAGVLLAVAPKLGGGGSLPGYLSVLVGTLAFALTQTLNRALRAEAGIARILLWPSLMGVLVYGPLAARDWVGPPPGELIQLLANGIFAGAAVVCTAAAYKYADAARLGPFGFAALPVSVLFDGVLWGHPPDPFTLAGGAVVIAACVMSERARRRQGISEGKAWVPSGASGSGVTPRTAESGSGP